MSACSISGVYTDTGAHLRVKVKWKLKKMRATARKYFWEMTFNQACVQVRSITTQIQQETLLYTSFPFPNDKHLSLSSSALPPPPPPSFPLPSLSLFLYGWVVIFPWDSEGGELSRACCFIIPNKEENMFRPPHPEFRWKPSDRNSFFCRHALLVHTFPLFYIMLFYTCSLSLSWHHSLLLSCILFFLAHWWLIIFLSFCVLSCNCRNLQPKLNIWV